jgi:hypothetical protein
VWVERMKMNRRTKREMTLVFTRKSYHKRAHSLNNEMGKMEKWGAGGMKRNSSPIHNHFNSAFYLYNTLFLSP